MSESPPPPRRRRPRRRRARDRRRRRPRRRHVDPRHDDRQRRASTRCAREFHAPLSTIQWVSTGYMLALATVIPLTGWAADRFGTKRLYMISIVALPRRLGAVAALAWSAELADRLPRAAGPRRRHDHAGRHDDPHPARPGRSGGPRDEHRRRADAARPDPRPDPRRLARRRRLLALDLLREPARSARSRSSLALRILPARRRSRASGSTAVGLAAALPRPGALRLRALARSASAGRLRLAPRSSVPDARRRWR